MSHCLVIKVLCFLSLRQLVYFITSFFVCQELFQVFSNFFDVLLSNSLSRWQLVYFTTLRKDCQQVFWLFSKFFKLFLQKNHFFVTARLIYHFLSPLSTVFCTLKYFGRYSCLPVIFFEFYCLVLPKSYDNRWTCHCRRSFEMPFNQAAGKFLCSVIKSPGTSYD